MWNLNAKPTASNLRKRIDSAIEALVAAEVMIEARPSDAAFRRAKTRVANALAWARDARLAKRT